ncbi:PREDICTED: calexcitin-2 isoform X2 [Ceratosolen solmsi marchali]|nr:PREDICTED: calexcitin-2 isoform X2 [Ceratosolen solmsi marchali]XP_011498360.1 PREDICTED: calexcitin-2 isoform X2 [Ceratosolen solmsi marchali]
MPLSEFRKKKLLFVFNTFFDVNQSGSIDIKDFDLAVHKICEARGWAANHPRFQQTKDTLNIVWDGLRKRADADNDGQISRDEWYSMWEEYAKDPEHAVEWQQTYMNLVFDLEDTSGDGSIDETEFSQVCRSYGVEENESREAFKKLQVGNEVTREKFEKLWQQFFSSDDPTSAGNFIFGKTVY